MITMVTTWYLVLLVAVGDHWSLDPNHLPAPFKTQQECVDEGFSLMIDRRNEKAKLYCIEADDWQDLHDIMLKAFKFGGDNV